MRSGSKKERLIESMTGYGRGVSTHGHARFIAEVRSVNNRYLESRIHGVREDFSLEFELQKLFKQNFHRGKFDLMLRKEEIRENKFGLNEKQIFGHTKYLKQLQKKLGFAEPLKFETVLATLPQKQDSDDVASLHPYFMKAAQEAMEALKTSRRNEGRILSGDVKKRISEILEWFTTINAQLPEIRQRRRLEVKQKMDLAMQDSAVDPKRVETEIAFMIEKMDVTEEIVRFSKHLQSFDDLLNSPKYSEKSVGRELDFTMQEMNREMNTLGAKISNIDISKIVIDIKSEMEKIREQIQNIE